MAQYLESARGKENFQPQILYLTKLPFKNEGEIKTFSDKGNLEEFIASKPLLKEWLKEIFLTDRKEMIKERILEHQEGRQKKEQKYWYVQCIVLFLMNGISHI